MKTIGAFEAKTHFSRLLREVEQGESYQIMRRDKPIACLVGVTDQNREDNVRRMVERVRTLRVDISATQEEIREWIREGRA